MTISERDEIIVQFRDRIHNGDRFKLTKDDLVGLIDGFIDQLCRAKSQKKIQALCVTEIRLLEEGYPKASVSKYLSQYRKAIALAVESGDLAMTRATSHRFVHTQRVTGVQEERLEHWALTFLKYSQEDYEAFDSRSRAQDVEGVAIALDVVNEVKPVMLVPKRGAKRKAVDAQDLPDDWLLEMERRVEQLRAEFQAQLQEVRQESNAGWFIRRVETLERENLALRLERDKAIALHGGGIELELLKKENNAITTQLNAANQKLEGFRRLLNGSDQVEQPEGPTVENTTIGPSKGRAFKRAEAIVLGIKEWNRLNPDESFAISPGVLESIFRVHRQATKDFFERYQDEILSYHQDIGVDSPRWHNRGKDVEKMRSFVQEWVKGN
jgi:Telomere resolvase